MATIWGVLGLVLTGLVTALAGALLGDLFKARFPAQHRWLTSHRGAAAAQGFMSAVCLAIGLAFFIAAGNWPVTQADDKTVTGGLFILAAAFFFALLARTIRQARFTTNH